MQIIDCEQQTEEWYRARLGKVTASHFADVLNKKSGRKTYMMRLLVERLTGIRQPTWSGKYMEQGSEKEPEGREHYEWITDVDVKQVGYVQKSEDVGCSPDGLISTEGVLEIKCPLITTHLTYIMENRLPPVYKAQVQGQLWVCERQWCDFVSYSPEYPKQPLWMIRVERDEEYLALLSAACATFVTDMQAIEKKLRVGQ